MFDRVTLILILHNRHANLNRLLEYYKNIAIRIIIADSSIKKYSYSTTIENCEHIYTPGKTFTQKIEYVLNYIVTPFTVLCADDDFILPASIMQCVHFLDMHRDFAIAQGKALSYKFEDIYTKNRMYFNRLYPNQNYDIVSDDPLERLQLMFQNYRSVLYAVHKTANLKFAFQNAGAIINNLYLNEYVTAIFPILSGKYKEIDKLYQVREFDKMSDDKTTDNLDSVYTEQKYTFEMNNFLDFISTQSSEKLQRTKNETYKIINEILYKFSKSHLISKHSKLSSKKKLGFSLNKIPVIGPWMIEKNRLSNENKILREVVKTDEEKVELEKIKELISIHRKDI